MKTTVLTTPVQSIGTARDRCESRTREPPENRDSYYFPGCRKDANCHCEKCLESINATLDLQSSLTKLSSISPNKTTYWCSGRSIPASPIPNSCQILPTPFRSTAKSRFLRTCFDDQDSKSEKCVNKKVGVVGSDLGRLILIFGLIFMVHFGVPWLIFKFFKPKLSPEMVGKIGEETGVKNSLNDRFDFVQRELGKIVDERISNCSASSSVWELNQEGSLLQSRCVLFKSMAEEVSIWGWPLQATWLLTAGSTSRSLTVISGRVTEWQEGNLKFSIRKENSSWVQTKWSSCAMQLDRNTWVLEYHRRRIVENPSLLSTALELMRIRTYKLFQDLKKDFWLLPVVPDHHSYHMPSKDFEIPT